ncbi:MAG: T9SS type A sorting domain-containing protein, partial [Rhodothermales bacterium]|nr:T9SS type A sorting domain-containing protein [Rhodothermales bacterium]
NALRVDDRSDGISFAGNDAGTVFAVGERLDFMQGILWYSFGNFKLMPDDLATDVGPVTNVGTEDESLPGKFALGQNYPNPFNPSTTIEYSVPATGSVTLEVYDMLGRSVALLVDGERAAGTYTAQFDATELASGMYLYRLTAGSDVQVRKMMLLK